ncbi:MAG: alpha-amylase/4-alpha-glucanotransferase domain-containing protein [Nitrospirota bacterium]
MSKLYLILALHNHQPVGNFDHVLEESYRKAYLPLLKTLNRHPSLKVVLHYSGNLLSWFEKRHPEIFGMMNELVRSERIEILSGGFYEPILSAIPENDRIPQIKELSGYIKKHFGYSPEGMWLAERVWEPQMPKYISMAGIKYVPVDDYHFKLSGLDEGDLLGYYITEEEGYKLSIFPGSEKLRYYIPFRNINEIFSYFREIYMKGGNPLLTMADDGEKFGVWPETYKHCYEDGWLERFFNAIEENSDWIETTTFSEYYSKFHSIGRVYLPTASYREMGEWALPFESALDYEYALTEMQRLMGEKAKGLLRGGIWRSFFAKYPESNHIHKRMLMISKKVHKAVKKLKVESSKPSTRSQAAGLKVKKLTTYDLRLTTHDLLHELWMGQCNDAYWHGIFGGLYLPHLRSSLYRHLLKAESIADNILNPPESPPTPLWKRGAEGDLKGGKGGFLGEKITVERSDYDCDGFEDLSISTRDITMSITELGGSLIELSVKKKAINILDILTRRPEAYHSKIAQASAANPGETRTIHEQLIVKEADITDYMVYDKYRRASLLDHFLLLDTDIDDLMRSEYEELGDFIESIYSLKHFKKGDTVTINLSRNGIVNNTPLRIEKTLRLTRPLELRVDYRIDGIFHGLIAIEFNISLLGSPYSSIIIGDRSLPIRSKEAHKGVKEFYLKDEFLNLVIGYNFDEKMDLWHYPVETTSLSEKGVEKLYQGTAFLFVKRLDFSDEERLGFTISLFTARR